MIFALVAVVVALIIAVAVYTQIAISNMRKEVREYTENLTSSMSKIVDLVDVYKENSENSDIKNDSQDEDEQLIYFKNFPEEWNNIITYNGYQE